MTPSADVDVDRLQPGVGLLGVGDALLAARARHRRGDAERRVAGERGPRRPASRSGCGSRRRRRSATARTRSPTAASRARTRASRRRARRRRRGPRRAGCPEAGRREDVEQRVAAGHLTPGAQTGGCPVGRSRGIATVSRTSSTGALNCRSRSRAAASARTRAGRAPASPGGSRASPRARPRRRGLVVGAHDLGLRLHVGRRELGRRLAGGRLGARRRPPATARRGGAGGLGLRLGRRGLRLGLERRLGLMLGRLGGRLLRRRGAGGAGSACTPSGRANSPLRGSPSASSSCRATSSGSAPRRRLSSRCSRMASSSSPIRPPTAYSAFTVRFLPERFAR